MEPNTWNDAEDRESFRTGMYKALPLVISVPSQGHGMFAANNSKFTQ